MNTVQWITAVGLIAVCGCTFAQETTNVSLNKPAIADSAYESTTGSCGTKGTKSACSADRAVDGSLEDLNRWLSGTDSLTHYLAIDLEAEHVISKVQVYFVGWDDDKLAAQTQRTKWSYGVCRHAISVWAGDASLTFKEAVASSHGWDVVVREDDFSLFGAHDSELFDFGSFSGRYIKLDFDNSRCPSEIVSAKGGFVGIIRVSELQVFGYPQSTTTATTVTTTTTTTTTNTDVAALHNRIDGLLATQVDAANVNSKVQAMEELMQSLQAQQAAHDTVVKALQATVAALGADKAALAQRVDTLESALVETTAKLDAFVTSPNRPAAANSACDASGCEPAISANGVGNDMTSGELKLSALGGSVIVESKGCAPIDICDLSRDVQSVLDKFNPGM